MPKNQKNKSWVALTREFVKEWPEVLDGIHFTNMPVKYLKFVNIILKNNITIHFDIQKELKVKKQSSIARFLASSIKKNYLKIKTVELKFDVPLLKKDMEKKTDNVLKKSFRLNT